MINLPAFTETREPRDTYRVSLRAEIRQETVETPVKAGSDGTCGQFNWFSGPIALDFAGYLADTSCITPAPPLPLVGEAHLGQVFLCAGEQSPFLHSARCHDE